MNTQQANPLSSVGTVNSLVTVLIAGTVIAVGCLSLTKKGANSKKLLAAGLVLVGAFFIVYSLVALSVPVYASFWYLTDFWMLTLPILGVALLAYLNRASKLSLNTK